MGWLLLESLVALLILVAIVGWTMAPRIPRRRRERRNDE
jgi:type II secretory pathway pseudopilin PulG